MRDFLSEQNLARAAAVSAAVALMSWPRLLQAGRPPWLLGMVFLSMMFIAGAATAWGRRAGLAGLIPERARLKRGLLAAAGAAALLAPLYRYALDAHLRTALTAAGAAERIHMNYPMTAGGVLALMLWSAGFETMFFRAGAMAFFARLTNRAWVAVAGAAALRIWVTHLHVRDTGLGDMELLFQGATLLDSLAACLLYARGGWPAAGLFAALMSARLFLPR